MKNQRKERAAKPRSPATNPNQVLQHDDYVPLEVVAAELQTPTRDLFESWDGVDGCPPILKLNRKRKLVRRSEVRAWEARQQQGSQ